jgi:hypothetical protein
MGIENGQLMHARVKQRANGFRSHAGEGRVRVFATLDESADPRTARGYIGPAAEHAPRHVARKQRYGSERSCNATDRC